MRLWSEDSGLFLLTPEEFSELPDGTRLFCIDNQAYTKGVDYIDDDTRYGCMAYGLTPKLAESQGLMHKFIIWRLKS